MLRSAQQLAIGWFSAASFVIMAPSHPFVVTVRAFDQPGRCAGVGAVSGQRDKDLGDASGLGAASLSRT